MVVSDDCVLIRAGRQPAEGEEGPSGSGHWVAWIGQVPTLARDTRFAVFVSDDGAGVSFLLGANPSHWARGGG